jgi:hypothetical protein
MVLEELSKRFEPMGMHDEKAKTAEITGRRTSYKTDREKKNASLGTRCIVLLGLGINQLGRVLKWLKPHVGKIEVGTGVVMIVAGLLIFFNLLPYFNRFFNLGINV